MAPKRKSDGTEPQRKSARLRSDAPDAPGPAKPKAEKKPAAAKKASPAPATSASDHKVNAPLHDAVGLFADSRRVSRRNRALCLR